MNKRIIILLLTVTILSCSKSDDKKEAPAPPKPNAWALSEDGELMAFRVDEPGTILSTIPLTANYLGKQLVGIDIRPIDGKLYGFTRGKIWQIDPATGAATNYMASELQHKVYGLEWGVDFNPMSDQVRVCSDDDENVRFVLETGAVAGFDGPLQPTVLTITSAAYSNNTKGAASTELYHIANQGILVKQRNPPTGFVTSVGQLGIQNISLVNGFDISGADKAYAILTSNGVTKLYRINLQTGAASAIGNFPKPVKGLALQLDL